MDDPSDLSDQWGVQQDWVDADDQPQRAPDATVDQVRAVIGHPPADLDQRAPVVTRPGRTTGLRGQVRCEDGSARRLSQTLQPGRRASTSVATAGASSSAHRR